MCLDRPAIEISPEKIREAAWELWNNVDDGILNVDYPIEDYDEAVIRLIRIVLQDNISL